MTGQAFIYDAVRTPRSKGKKGGALLDVKPIDLGAGVESRILVVVHCERGEKGEELRIISARKATTREREYYQGDPP